MNVARILKKSVKLSYRSSADAEALHNIAKAFNDANAEHRRAVNDLNTATLVLEAETYSDKERPRSGPRPARIDNDLTKALRRVDSAEGALNAARTAVQAFARKMYEP